MRTGAYTVVLLNPVGLAARGSNQIPYSSFFSFFILFQLSYLSELASISQGWECASFNVLNHREVQGLHVLGSLEDIFNLLEENQVTLQTMLGSKFIHDIQKQVEDWERKLSHLSDILDEWSTCQRSWMNLEYIFSGEDIQKQLPAESQKFIAVDKTWKAIMTRTYGDSLVIASVYHRH